MVRFLFLKTALFVVLSTSMLQASNYSNSCELGLGWRQDNLHWKMHDKAEFRSKSSSHSSDNHLKPDPKENHLDKDSNNDTSFLSTRPFKERVHSTLDFNGIDLFSCNGRARFIGCGYYIRFEAEYGISDKGRLTGHRHMYNPFLGSLFVQMDRPIKRRSEVYDFSGAVGFPFVFCENRLQTYPLIGFSFHRQQLNVEHKHHLYLDSSEGYFIDEGSFSSSSSSSSSSDWQKRDSNYRFSWYGFFVGVDLAYALDSAWSLRGEFEYHYGRCHRKEKACLDFNLMDRYHHESFAQGFNGNIGATVNFCRDWYFGFYVDTRWWKSDDKHDRVYWNSVGANATVGYLF
jgi:hypothetical protein